jgi:hypothetical protein
MTVVGQIPDFDPEGTMGAGAEEVKQTGEIPEEKDTPAELPADDQENGEQKPDGNVEDTSQPDPVEQAVLRATEGLRTEIVGLRQKIATLSGGDRKLAQEQLIVAQQKLDELDDVNPADVALIEKVIKAKGYVTKEEAQSVNYDTVQKQVLSQFLDKFPEYKPENDPENTNWNRLIGEYSLYAKPKDPLQIAALLERSHKATAPVASVRNLTPQKQAIKTASLGSGGRGRTSSGGKTLDPDTRRQYEDGGWSKEEIDEMEKRLA